MESYLLAINNEKDSLIEDLNKLEKNTDALEDIYYHYLIICYRDIILNREGFNYNQGKKETESNELMKFVRLVKNGDSEAQHNLAKWEWGRS